MAGLTDGLVSALPSVTSVEEIGQVRTIDPEMLARLREKMLKYDPDQPRDELGRWTATGGEGSARAIEYVSPTTTAEAAAQHLDYMTRNANMMRSYGADPDFFDYTPSELASLVISEYQRTGVEFTTPEFRERVADAATSLFADPVMREQAAIFGRVSVSAGTNYFGGTDPNAQGILASHFEGGLMLFESELYDDIPEVAEAPSPYVVMTGDWGGTEAVIAHEYGHHVYEVLTDPTRPANDVFGDGMSGEEVDRAWQRLYYNSTASEREDISQYSMASRTEAFSEAYAVVTSPQYTPEVRDAYDQGAQVLLDFVEKVAAVKR